MVSFVHLPKIKGTRLARVRGESSSIAGSAQRLEIPIDAPADQHLFEPPALRTAANEDPGIQDGCLDAGHEVVIASEAREIDQVVGVRHGDVLDPDAGSCPPDRERIRQNGSGRRAIALLRIDDVESSDARMGRERQQGRIRRRRRAVLARVTEKSAGRESGAVTAAAERSSKLDSRRNGEPRYAVSAPGEDRRFLRPDWPSRRALPGWQPCRRSRPSPAALNGGP